jgi:parallel beta-helix repeat protein
VRKRFVAVVFIVFLCVFSVLFPVAVCDDAGQTLTVRVDGAGNYTSIQEAIDAASSEDTVYVFPGIYYETVAVNKTITLLGEDKNTTIIDSSNSGFYAVLIQAQDVTLSGFTIQNSTVGVYVAGNKSVSNITITNNVITNNKDGIYLDNISNVVIFGNVITANDGNGIRLYGSIDNNIYENTISGHQSYGIVLWDSSYNNIISRNIITDNKNGVGLRRWSDNNIVSENNVSQNKNSGILLGYSFYNNLTGNSVIDNSNGISISDSSENFISANYIAYNHRGIYLYDSTNITIYDDNVFLGNDEDISEGSKTFKIPGFELVLIICAMLFVLLCKRKISI